jgi:hypothetical protein
LPNSKGLDVRILPAPDKDTQGGGRLKEIM